MSRSHKPAADADHLAPRSANYTPLSPLSLLQRTATVYPEYLSLIHGNIHYNWAQTYERCRRIASALRQYGIEPGATVAVLAPNIPAIYEAHFGVPMAGAILNTINTRLDAAAIAFILDHADAQVLMVDAGLASLAKEALELCATPPGLVVDIADDEIDEAPIGSIEYEMFIAQGDPEFAWQLPADEWQAISINYTSGTTGNPKGVIYHHRGAFLNALSNALTWNMGYHPTYLWTLPMFHCNGWCFAWTVAAMAGTNICLRNVNGPAIYDAIAKHGVTHFCGAPIVLSMVINTPEVERASFDHEINIMVAAAPPPAAVLENIERAGFRVTHVYGLTETYGPAVLCAWKTEWDELSSEQRAKQKSRQGVPYHVLAGLDVRDPETMQPVHRDGQSMGEVMFQGNIVMKGYLKNPQATDEALGDGWFHSGDLGVMHPDDYLQVKDRSKDVIISGGENISSIEVEDTLYQHSAVLEAAVVARPDDKWGETPCAFVALKPGHTANEQELIDFCREKLAHYKCPKTVVLGELPKTATGKIQKFKLRDQAKALGSL